MIKVHDEFALFAQKKRFKTVISTSKTVNNTIAGLCMYNIIAIPNRKPAFIHIQICSNRHCAVFICDSNKDDDAQHLSPVFH